MLQPLLKNMKSNLFLVFLILTIVALFGWRYYYLPNFVMASRSPVAMVVEQNSQAEKIYFESKPQTRKKSVPNMLKNGLFNDKVNNWQLWHSAKEFTNSIKFVRLANEKFGTAVRIENPMKKLVGIQQRVKVVSNTIYRLSGVVRSIATNNSKILFGGRLAFFIPGQKEKQIVWMSEYNQWWKKELIFTNQVTGVATVYVHMGYGNVASTGEFTNISLEKIK